MLLTTFGNTLAASLADPALSEYNTPSYIGLGTSDTPVTMYDSTLSAGYIDVEIDSISVSGSKVTILWKLPYDLGNELLSSIREIGVFAKNGKLLIRREFPLTEKMDRTRIFGKITVDLPILPTQNGVNSTLDPCISLSGEVGTVVGETSLEPGESGYFAVSFPSSNYEALTYIGTLELVEASGTGAILRMPAGASGTYAASWTASCGRSASASVSASVSANVCAIGLPRTGYGDPRGVSVDLTGLGTHCGTVTNTVVYSFPGGYRTDYWEVGGGAGWGVPWVCQWASASGTFYHLLVEEWT